MVNLLLRLGTLVLGDRLIGRFDTSSYPMTVTGKPLIKLGWRGRRFTLSYIHHRSFTTRNQANGLVCEVLPCSRPSHASSVTALLCLALKVVSSGKQKHSTTSLHGTHNKNKYPDIKNLGQQPSHHITLAIPTLSNASFVSRNPNCLYNPPASPSADNPTQAPRGAFPSNHVVSSAITAFARPRPRCAGCVQMSVTWKKQPPSPMMRPTIFPYGYRCVSLMKILSVYMCCC